MKILNPLCKNVRWAKLSRLRSFNMKYILPLIFSLLSNLYIFLANASKFLSTSCFEEILYSFRFYLASCYLFLIFFQSEKYRAQFDTQRAQNIELQAQLKDLREKFDHKMHELAMYFLF